MFRNCPDPIQLSAYLDGELSERRWLKIGLHLQKCSACRDKLAELEQVKKLVAQLPHRPAPEIRITAQQSPPKAAGKRWLWSSCLTAAAVLLLVFFVHLRQPQADDVAGEYLRIHRQYEQQLAESIELLEEVEAQ